MGCYRATAAPGLAASGWAHHREELAGDGLSVEAVEDRLPLDNASYFE
jgi:hypothetical protein